MLADAVAGIATGHVRRTFNTAPDSVRRMPFSVRLLASFTRRAVSTALLTRAMMRPRPDFDLASAAAFSASAFSLAWRQGTCVSVRWLPRLDPVAPAASRTWLSCGPCGVRVTPRLHCPPRTTTNQSTRRTYGHGASQRSGCHAHACTHARWKLGAQPAARVLVQYSLAAVALIPWPRVVAFVGEPDSPCFLDALQPLCPDTLRTASNSGGTQR